MVKAKDRCALLALADVMPQDGGTPLSRASGSSSWGASRAANLRDPLGPADHARRLDRACFNGGTVPDHAAGPA